MKLKTKPTVLKIKIDDITVEYMQVKPRRHAEITKKHTVHEGYGQDARDEIDEISVAEDLFVEGVKSWDGAVDDEGKPLPCTEDAKRGVFTYDQHFVMRLTNKFMEVVKKEHEGSAKN